MTKHCHPGVTSILECYPWDLAIYKGAAEVREILLDHIWWLLGDGGLLTAVLLVNTLRQRQNGRHFADDTFKHIFLNENVRISIKISLKFVPKGPINNIPALVHIMVWRRPGDKPLSEPMMVRLLTHICVTPPQWDNKNNPGLVNHHCNS